MSQETTMPRTDLINRAYLECKAMPIQFDEWDHRDIILAHVEKCYDVFKDQLETELAEAKAKLEYVDSIGIQIGVMKTTDCPEGMLAHIYRKGCTFDRVLKEWSHSIGWEEKLAESQARERELREALSRAVEIAERGALGRAGQSLIYVFRITKNTVEGWKETLARHD